MPSVLPTPEEAAAFTVGPESVAWQFAGDIRTMFGAGTALMLQVAHPTIAGGVREHSDFESDPWGRLMRTLDYVNLLVYGGPVAAPETGRRMREMHRRIKGIDPQGRRYNALEPEAYAWVHATLAESIVQSHARFGSPMTYAQIEKFWSEWRGLGRLLGVRERDMPANWAAYRVYVDGMIDEHLEDNDVVRTVLRTMGSPVAPPVPFIGPRSWKLLSAPASHTQRLATIALLPPKLRVKLDLTLTRGQELELRAISAASRSTTPVLPQSLRISGPNYLKWRRSKIAGGMFGPAVDAKPAAEPAADESAAAVA